MQLFVAIDVAGLAKQLQLVEVGLQDGRNNSPRPAETQLTNAEESVVAAIRQRLSTSRALTIETLHDLETKRNKADLDAVAAKLNSLTDTVVSDLHHGRERAKDHLVNLRHTERESFSFLKLFRHQNNLLNREAEYPDSSILHHSIISAILLSETVANSYFFAKGSDLGLLGGALQALLISCVNVGLAWLLGSPGLRFLHHIQWQFKLLGSLLFSIYISANLLFNLATAHYRAELEANPLGAIANVIPRMMNRLLGIDNFDAWVLFGIGTLASLLALQEFLRSDDKYPGFGKRTRQWRTAEAQYNDARAQLREVTLATLETARRSVEEEVALARAAVKEFPTLIGQTDTLLKAYANHQADATKALHSLLDTYRNANREMRHANPPAYFADYPDISDLAELPTGILDTHRAMVPNLNEHLKQVEQQAADTRTRLHDLSAKNDDDNDAFFAEVEAIVDRKLASGGAAPR